jgi:hypothetical protein
MMTTASRSRWATALVLLVWLRTVLPRVVSSFTTTKVAMSTNAAASAPTSGVADSLDHRLRLLILGLAIIIIIISARGAVLAHPFALAALLLPWLYIVFRDEYNAYSAGISNILVYPAIAIAIWMLRPPMQSLQVLGYLTGALAIGSIAMGLFTPHAGILQSATLGTAALDKQIFSSGVLVGPFTTENALGHVLAIGAPTVLLIRRPAWRWLLLAATAYAVLWTSARGSIATLIVFAVVVLAMTVTSPRTRAFVGSSLGIAVLAVVVITPLVARNPTAFTNRGLIWQQSLSAWAADRPFGLGSDWYSRQLASSQIVANTASQGHNEYVHLLATGGIVLVALVAILCVTLLNSAGTSARLGELFPIEFVVPYFAAFWLEQGLGFIDQNYLFPVTIVPLAFILFAIPRRQDTSTADSEATASPVRAYEPEYLAP